MFLSDKDVQKLDSACQWVERGLLNNVATDTGAQLSLGFGLATIQW